MGSLSARTIASRASEPLVAFVRTPTSNPNSAQYKMKFMRILFVTRKGNMFADKSTHLNPPLTYSRARETDNSRILLLNNKLEPVYELRHVKLLRYPLAFPLSRGNTDGSFPTVVLTYRTSSTWITVNVQNREVREGLQNRGSSSGVVPYSESPYTQVPQWTAEIPIEGLYGRPRQSPFTRTKRGRSC